MHLDRLERGSQVIRRPRAAAKPPKEGIMTKPESRARLILKNTRTLQLIEQFELTETMNDRHIPRVRGWIMDELQKRDPVAFDEWIESWEESPRKFFIA